MENNENNNRRKDVKNFFNSQGMKDPKDIIGIFWLSEEMFTINDSSNLEFMKLYENYRKTSNRDLMSFNEILSNYFIINNNHPTQRGKVENGIESYRPHLVFYHKLTRCTWAIPLTTSYDSELNPYNTDFFNLNPKIYFYIPTCVLINNSTVETSCAFPVTKNMINMSIVNKEKYERDYVLDNYIETNFSCNNFFYNMAFKDAHKFYISRAQNKSFAYSTIYSFFVLNFLYNNPNLCEKLTKKYTTVENISKLKTYSEKDTLLINYTKTLESELKEFFLARKAYDEVSTCNDEQLIESALNNLNAISKNVSETTEKLCDNLKELCNYNLSSCDFDINFANDFIYYCTNEAESISPFNTALSGMISSHKVLENHISSLEEKLEKENEELSKKQREREKQEKAKQESDRRKKQSEKSKENYAKSILTNANNNLNKILDSLRYYNYTITSFLDTINKIDYLKTLVKNSTYFRKTGNQDQLSQNITKCIYALHKDIDLEANELVELLSETLNAFPEEYQDIFVQLTDVAKSKEKNREFNEEQLKLLGDNKTINSIIQSIELVENNYTFANELIGLNKFLANSPEFEIYTVIDKYNELMDLRTEYTKLFVECFKSQPEMETLIEIPAYKFTFNTFDDLLNEFSQTINDFNEKILFYRSKIWLVNQLYEKINILKRYENIVEHLRTLNDDQLRQYYEYGVPFDLQIPTDITPLFSSKSTGDRRTRSKYTSPKDLNISKEVQIDILAEDIKLLHRLLDLYDKPLTFQVFLESLGVEDEVPQEIDDKSIELCINSYKNIISELEQFLTIPQAYGAYHKSKLNLLNSIIDKASLINLENLFIGKNTMLFLKSLMPNSKIDDLSHNSTKLIQEIYEKISLKIYDEKKKFDGSMFINDIASLICYEPNFQPEDLMTFQKLNELYNENIKRILLYKFDEDTTLWGKFIKSTQAMQDVISLNRGKAFNLANVYKEDLYQHFERIVTDEIKYDARIQEQFFNVFCSTLDETNLFIAKTLFAVDFVLSNYKKQGKNDLYMLINNHCQPILTRFFSAVRSSDFEQAHEIIDDFSKTPRGSAVIKAFDSLKTFNFTPLNIFLDED